MEGLVDLLRLLQPLGERHGDVGDQVGVAEVLQRLVDAQGFALEIDGFTKVFLL